MPGQPVQPRWNVHRYDRAARPVDDSGQFCREVPRQPRSEQGVDDQARALNLLHLLQRPVPARRHGRRIALQRLPGAQQRQPNRPAPGLEKSRDDKSIPAIVARPAQHEDLVALDAPDRHPRFLRGVEAGVRHQLALGDSCGDRRFLEVAHLAGGDELGH